MKRTVAVIVLLISPFLVSSCRYRSCAVLHGTFRHGVGLPGAVDATKGTPAVTNYAVDAGAYAENRGLDRDHDNIACEQL